MMVRHFRKSVVALAVTSLLGARVRADSPPQAPALLPTARAEQPTKRIVLLYNGTKYCGNAAEATADGEVVLTLASGEVRRIAASDVMRVMPAVGAESAERLVVLTTGTMLRGELVENVPNNHLTLLLAEGGVRRFEWAQLSQVQLVSPASPATKRVQLSYQNVQYGGEVMEYVPKQSIALRLDGGEFRRFPLSEVQQLTDFVPMGAPPLRPPPSPLPPPRGPARPQQFADAKGDQPSAEAREAREESPAARKSNARIMLINGGIFTAIGIGVLTGGIILLKNARDDRDPLAFISGLTFTIIGSTHLAIGPVLLGVGGYRYTTPLQYE